MSKKFAILGVAGYIAPRHLKAIKETNNELVAAFDPFDSVGVLDEYFPYADFFTEFERFDRHIDKSAQKGESIDYLVICSPNYFHDAHIRYGLRNNMDVICEKPIVLNPWNLEGLEDLEIQYKRKINTILQLRLHPEVKKLKEKIDSENKDNYQVSLDYITPRGNWYDYSWKGDMSKSGGIATNIGIHFFDMLIWIFGDVIDYSIEENKSKKMRGKLSLEKAEVNWMLSIDKNDLPIDNNANSLRKLKINNEEFNFSSGFTDLHTLSYEEILKGKGFGIEDAKKSIELVSKLR